MKCFNGMTVVCTAEKCNVSLKCFKLPSRKLLTGEVPVQHANGSSEGVRGHLRVQVLRYENASEGQSQKRMHWLLARETQEDGGFNSGQDFTEREDHL